MQKMDQTRRFNPDELIHIGKFDPRNGRQRRPLDGRGLDLVKLYIETSSLDQRFSHLSDHKESRLLFATPSNRNPTSVTRMKVEQVSVRISALPSFIDVKELESSAINSATKNYRKVVRQPSEIPDIPHNRAVASN
ncbi:MAG: hypothetical protein IPN74_17895 [Haliscomenobacter sp.]|nr:hypothetical protein [Haliscomenobacter sp.]